MEQTATLFDRSLVFGQDGYDHVLSRGSHWKERSGYVDEVMPRLLLLILVHVGVSWLLFGERESYLPICGVSRMSIGSQLNGIRLTTSEMRLYQLRD